MGIMVVCTPSVFSVTMGGSVLGMPGVVSATFVLSVISGVPDTSVVCSAGVVGASTHPSDDPA